MVHCSIIEQTILYYDCIVRDSLGCCQDKGLDKSRQYLADRVGSTTDSTDVDLWFVMVLASAQRFGFSGCSPKTVTLNACF